jgi:protease II
MDKEKLEAYVNEYLKSKNLTISPSTEATITSPKYLNETLLDDMDAITLKKNLSVLLDETIIQYRERTGSAKRPTKVRDIDVRPVLKRKKCKLPPFC